MLTRFGAKRFEASGSSHFFGRSAVATLGSASLTMCAYGAPSLAEFPEAEFVRLQFAFSGAARTTIARQSVEVSASQSCVTPADRRCRIEFGAGYRQILLRVEQGAMERKITALLGAKPRGRLEFATGSGQDHRHLESLKSLIRFLAGELATSTIQLPHFLLREFEETLLVAFLKAVPNSFSDRLHRAPNEDTAAHVRRIEEYIDAHWELPLTVEDLAKVAFSLKTGDLSGLGKSIIDPLTRQPFPGNIIPTNRIDSISKGLMAYYPALNNPAIASRTMLQIRPPALIRIP